MHQAYFFDIFNPKISNQKPLSIPKKTFLKIGGTLNLIGMVGMLFLR
jgi:hypothetical protein